jgi:hypothetical protein
MAAFGQQFDAVVVQIRQTGPDDQIGLRTHSNLHDGVPLHIVALVEK